MGLRNMDRLPNRMRETIIERTDRAIDDHPFESATARHMIDCLADRLGTTTPIFVSRSEWNPEKPVVAATFSEIQSAYPAIADRLFEHVSQKTSALFGEKDVTGGAAETYTEASGGAVQWDLLILPEDVTVPEIGAVIDHVYTEGNQIDIKEGKRVRNELNDFYRLLADGATYLEQYIPQAEIIQQKEYDRILSRGTDEKSTQAQATLRNERWDRGIEATRALIEQMRRIATAHGSEAAVTQDAITDERIDQVETFLLGPENAEKRRKRAEALTEAVVEGHEGPSTISPDERQRMGEQFALLGETAFRASRVEVDDALLQSLRERNIAAFIYGMGEYRADHAFDEGAGDMQRSTMANLERAAKKPVYELFSSVWHLGQKQLFELMSVEPIAAELETIGYSLQDKREQLVRVLPINEMRAQLDAAREKATETGDMKILGDAELEVIQAIRKVVSTYDYKRGAGGEVSLTEMPIDNRLNCVEFSTLSLQIAEQLGLNMRALSVPGHSLLMSCTADGRIHWQEMQSAKQPPEVKAEDLERGEQDLDLLRDAFMQPENYPDGVVVHYTNLELFRKMASSDASQHECNFVAVLPKRTGTLSQIMEWCIGENFVELEEGAIITEPSRWKDAQWVFDFLAEQGGRNDVLYKQCVILEKMGNYVELFHAAADAVRTFPGEEAYYYFLAIAAKALGTPEKQVPILQEAADRFPNNRKTHLALAKYYLEEKGFIQSDSYIDGVIDTQHNPPWAHWVRAKIIEEQIQPSFPDSFELAERHMASVMEENSSDAGYATAWKEYVNEWINNFKDQEKYDKLYAVVEKCIARKADPDFYSEGILALKKLGRNDEAAELIQKGLEQFPESAKLIRQKAEYVYDTEGADAAKTYLGEQMKNEISSDLMVEYVSYFWAKQDYAHVRTFVLDFLQKIDAGLTGWNKGYFQNWLAKAEAKIKEQKASRDALAA